jgi:hypothetical protein
VDYYRLAEKLRKELDVHSAFTWEKFLNQGLDAHFDGRIQLPDYTEKAARISDYWRQTTPQCYSDGEFTCPSSLRRVACYGKNVFNLVAFRTKLPALTKNEQEVWLGFEDGAQTGTGMAAFRLFRTSGVEKFRVHAGGQFQQWSYLDITGALPSDAKTAMHVYGVALLKSWAEFLIDGIPVAFCLNSPNLAFPSINYPPYGIFGPATSFPARMIPLIEVAAIEEELTLPLAPSNVRFGHTSEHPPRVFRLYQAGSNTLLAGLTVSSGSVTSHPVPVFGYAGKTLYFMANQAGSLLIEVLTQTGNWRTYDTDTVSANTLWWYKMTGDAILARLTFTPSTYPCSIAEGEVVLDG